jgi:hypothetical protein
VRLLDGNTFVVSDGSGDIEATGTDPGGLFSFDTRYLSLWTLRIDGMRLSPLSVDDLRYYEARFFLVPGDADVYVDAQLSVVRQRSVCDGFREDILIVNHAADAVDLRVRIEAGSDFADLFDVKNNAVKEGSLLTRVEGGRLVLGYQRETFQRETLISADQSAHIDEHGLTFLVHLEPQQEWTTRLQVTPTIVRRGRLEPLVSGRRAGAAGRDMAADLQQARSQLPTLRCDWAPFAQIYERARSARLPRTVHVGRSLDVDDGGSASAVMRWVRDVGGRCGGRSSLVGRPVAGARLGRSERKPMSQAPGSDAPRSYEDVRARLRDAYRDRCPIEQIDQAFDDALRALDDARVQTFVPVLIERAVRERLADRPPVNERARMASTAVRGRRMNSRRR